MNKIEHVGAATSSSNQVSCSSSEAFAAEDSCNQLPHRDIRTFRPVDVRPVTFDLETLIRELNLSPDAEKYVRETAQCPSRPIRSSRSRLVYAPIPRFGHSIGQESQSMEYAGALIAAYNAATLEFFEQPSPVFGKIQSASGRQYPVKYTPDLLVVTHRGIEIQEFKPEAEIASYIAKRNPLYSEESGVYRNVWAERYFANLGFRFRLITERNICPRFYEAARILHPYTAGYEFKTEISDEEREIVLAYVRQYSGIHVRDLPIEDMGRRAEIVYFLLARAFIFTSWSENDLKDPNSLRLYPSAVDELAFAKYEEQHRPVVSDASELGVRLQIGSYVELKSVPYSVTRLDQFGVTLTDSAGERTTISISSLALLNPRIGKSSAVEHTFEARFRKLSPEQRVSYLVRKSAVSSYLPGGNYYGLTPKTRKERDWLRKYKASTAGDKPGDEGLLPDYSWCGRKMVTMSKEVEHEFTEALKMHRSNPKKCSVEWIWNLLVSKFGLANLVSKRTIYRRIECLNKFKEAIAVAGPRLASKHEPYFGDNPILGSHRGTRSWQNAHVDSTPLDLELEGAPRQWLTLLVDSFDNRILAGVVSGNRVDGESVRLLLETCVAIHGLLPHSITCDRGSEHRTKWLHETLLRINVTIIYRRTACGRDGSPVEGTFSAMCKTLVHNLEGNTKYRKQARLLTKAYDPENRKIWTEFEFAALLDEYTQLRNDIPMGKNPSPNSLCESCSRNYGPPPKQLPNLEAFRILLLPLVPRLPKVSERGLIRCNRRIYGVKGPNNPLMKFIGKILQVRHDPKNPEVVYVYLPGRSGCLELHDITPILRPKIVDVLARKLDAEKEAALAAQGLPASPVERKASFISSVEDKQASLATAKKMARRALREKNPRPLGIVPDADSVEAYFNV